MKTYFMAWESDNKRGHSIYDFNDDIPPRQALNEMRKAIHKEFSESDIPIKGIISATQFNCVK